MFQHVRVTGKIRTRVDRSRQHVQRGPLPQRQVPSRSKVWAQAASCLSRPRFLQTTGGPTLLSYRTHKTSKTIRFADSWLVAVVAPAVSEDWHPPASGAPV